MRDEDIVERLKKKLIGLEGLDLTKYNAYISASEVKEAIEEIERLRGYMCQEGWGLEYDDD